MKALLALPLVFAFAFAGCTGSGPVTPAQDAEGDYIIHLTAGNKFSPMSAKVPVGSTVAWVHDGGAPHDVQGNNADFSSGPAGGMHEGDRFERQFNETGTFSYFCHIHMGSGMKGTLVVE